MPDRLDLTCEHLMLSRTPPSIRTVSLMNEILPELEELFGRLWEGAKERKLDPEELFHVHAWIFDRIALSLYFIENKEFARLARCLAKEVEQSKAGVWKARQERVERLKREGPQND